VSALSGIKVLDLSRFIAGPFCAMQLADMGADVIKVERPAIGEDQRAIDPRVGGESLYVMAYNRNKRGMTLDLRHPRAQQIVRDLAASADIVIENFRPGTMEKMGCGYDVLSKANPRLVMVRISGFGQDGPLADKPCFDVIAQAMSGLMEITGQPDGPPTMTGTFVVDYASALYATIGALGALRAREVTGRGQVVDVALLDSAVSLLMTAIPEYLLLGKTTTRRGNRDRYTAPANSFRTASGDWVLLSCGNNTLFPRFARAAGLARLLDDTRFADANERMTNVDALERIVADWAAARTTDEVLRVAAEADVPCAKINTIADVVANPQLRHREQIVEVDHPTIGRLPMHGLTVKFHGTPGEIARAAPSIGQHTDEVLREWLGFDDATIRALHEERVV
jgi:crotonobetainyl-CoA:carnitine CoA-transferase CaiB-like acyl-CoA transferase